MYNRSFSHPYIKRAIPMIEMAADNLGHRAMDLDKRMPASRAGRPYWVNQVIQETMKLSGKISTWASEAREDYDQHRFYVVQSKVQAARLANNKILDRILSGPFPGVVNEEADPLIMDIRHILVENWPTKEE